MATLKDYRQFAAREAGPFFDGTSDSTGNTVNNLVDSDWPIKSTLDQSELFRDYYLHIPSNAAADKTRRVSTYTPSTGTITVDQSFSAAPDNKAYELHGLLEPSTWHQLINEALKRCFTVVEVTGTPTADRNRHSLTTVSSWLRNPAWVYQVGYLSSGEDRNKVDPYQRVVRGEVVQDGNIFYLNHPGRVFLATDVLYLKLIKPLYNHCRASGGNYGDQNGLSLDTDEAPAPAEWVGWGAITLAWHRYGHLLAQDNERQIKMSKAEAASMFTHYTHQNFSEPEKTLRKAPIVWGPRWR